MAFRSIRIVTGARDRVSRTHACLVVVVALLLIATAASAEERQRHLIVALDLSESITKDNPSLLSSSLAVQLLRSAGNVDNITRLDVIAFADCADVLFSSTGADALAEFTRDAAPFQHVLSGVALLRDHESNCSGSHQLDRRKTDFAQLFAQVNAQIRGQRSAEVETLLWIFSDGHHDPMGKCDSPLRTCGVAFPGFTRLWHEVLPSTLQRTHVVLAYLGRADWRETIDRTWSPLLRQDQIDFTFEPSASIDHLHSDLVDRMLKAAGPLVPFSPISCTTSSVSGRPIVETTLNVAGSYSAPEVRFDVLIEGLLPLNSKTSEWSDTLVLQGTHPITTRSTVWVEDTRRLNAPNREQYVAVITFHDDRFHWQQQNEERLPCVPAESPVITIRAADLWLPAWRTDAPYTFKVDPRHDVSQTTMIVTSTPSESHCPLFFSLDELTENKIEYKSPGTGVNRHLISLSSGATSLVEVIRGHAPRYALGGCTIQQLRGDVNMPNLPARQATFMFDGETIKDVPFVTFGVLQMVIFVLAVVPPLLSVLFMGGRGCRYCVTWWKSGGSVASATPAPRPEPVLQGVGAIQHSPSLPAHASQLLNGVASPPAGAPAPPPAASSCDPSQLVGLMSLLFSATFVQPVLLASLLPLSKQQQALLGIFPLFHGFVIVSMLVLALRFIQIERSQGPGSLLVNNALGALRRVGHGVVLVVSIVALFHGSLDRILIWSIVPFCLLSFAGLRATEVLKAVRGLFHRFFHFFD